MAGRDLRSVLEAVLDGVLVVDAEGRVELSNSEACRLLATSAESTLAQPLETIVGPRHAIAALTRGVLESGRAAAWREIPLAQRFGSELLVDAAAAPLFDADGKPDGVVLMLRDRTIQNSLQLLVSEREALESFGRIAAGVAHEVKNPLGGIRGAAEILASRASDAKTLDAAELIVREVDRIATLVDDLMVFTHGEDLHCAPVNIHFVLDGVLDLLAMDPLSAGVRVKRRFDPSIPELLADADRLTQVFLNLARNALQAMEGRGGALSITTRMSLDHHFSVAGAGEEHAPTLLVEIADEGPGIPPALLARLATPFFTTRAEGTGLGLAVSRHWVSRHGGTLRIESTPGEGTCVRIALPLRRAG
jgi:two-component system nitrogen regulation sensor histidine kinase GlnL